MNGQIAIGAGVGMILGAAFGAAATGLVIGAALGLAGVSGSGNRPPRRLRPGAMTSEVIEAPRSRL